MEGLQNVTSGIIDGLGSAIDSLGDFLGGILNSLLGALEQVAYTIASIMDFIIDLPFKIVELLGDLLKTLFVPKNDFFKDKINDFKSRFAFVNSISEIMEMLKDSFTSTDFGTLEVDLGAAEGNVDYGGKVNVLDVSWYARYKPYGDSIISAFLWIVFVFNVYKQLPSIINGGGGAVVTVAKNSGDD